MNANINKPQGIRVDWRALAVKNLYELFVVTSVHLLVTKFADQHHPIEDLLDRTQLIGEDKRKSNKVTDMSLRNREVASHLCSLSAGASLGLIDCSKSPGWGGAGGYRKIVLLLGVLIIALSTGHAQGAGSFCGGDQYSVALFTGSGEDDPFWNLFIDFMQEATNDLSIKLEVHFSDGDRDRMAAQVHEVCQRTDKPDAIVVQSFKRYGPKILRIAEEYRVPVFLLNAGLSVKQQKAIGGPRKKLKYWIGEMLPDDYGAGYQLANALIDEARLDPNRLGPDGRVHVIGLNGNVSHEASIQRAAGLVDAIANRSDEAVLDQVVAADWVQKLARSRCRILHRRYPDARVVWAASDFMATGAIEAMRDRGLTPGKDVIIGGVDATPEAIELIKQGTLCATVGGHFMEGGWVAVMLHDFFHGVDLARIPTHYDSPMILVTRNSIADYQAGIDRSAWERADFLQLSLLHDPSLKNYRFDAKALFNMPSALEVPVPPSNPQEEKGDGERDE